jgi:hypothetical protein
MTDPESPAARRHRIAREMRAAYSIDAAAQLLEAHESDLLAFEDLDALDAVDLPFELCDLESLDDWSYETLLAHAVSRRPAPAFRRDGKAPCVMRADDLLDCRRYDLIGLLALAAEQAFEIGDAKTCKMMSVLCQDAIVRVIGVATMRLAFGAGEEYTGQT